MGLNLMYITNSPEVALVAEKNGVDRIWIDLETLGKEERQKNINSVKSHHTIHDIEVMSKTLTKSELMVRINPWNENSVDEIEKVIAAGADRIMLPMWKTPATVSAFLGYVNKRVATTLLLETKEAAECLDEVLKNPLVDEIHIGLNDLHLSYGMTFMFELLADGTVDKLCKKITKAGIPFGFGGIARIGEGMLPAEYVIMEHYRLGSTRAILSRSFCNAEEISDIEQIEKIFSENMKKLRDYENLISKREIKDLSKNRRFVKQRVLSIVKTLNKREEMSMYNKYFKRFFDVIFCSVALALLSPLLLIVAVAIKLESPGPVIFKQVRLGKFGNPFKIYKFRSMCNNAEHKGSGQYSFKNDPRVTRVGRIIRATSIDELPQLINIIKGDMSLIGFRPPLTYHPWPFEEYTEKQKKMFQMRPGVTGWAQIHGRKDVLWEDRIEMGIYYAENVSFALDIKIFFITIWKVLSNADNENKDVTVKNQNEAGVDSDIKSAEEKVVK